MNELPTYWAEKLRSATNDCARVFARRALATSIHRLAGERLRAKRVPADVADAEANYLAYELGRRIEDGTVQPGLEDPYVRRCASNRAADYYRETSGVHSRCELREDHEELADDRNPERLLSDYEEAAVLAVRVERLRALVASAPETHRAVLHEVYVKGTLIEVLAEQLLAARVVSGLERVADAAALRRARASVDQRLTRAREWIRARVGVVVMRTGVAQSSRRP